MNEKTVQAMLGPCEACGAPASDMCDCCLGCHRLQRRLAEVERERDEARMERDQRPVDKFKRMLNELSCLRRQVDRLQRGNTIESDFITRHEESLQHENARLRAELDSEKARADSLAKRCIEYEKTETIDGTNVFAVLRAVIAEMDEARQEVARLLSILTDLGLCEHTCSRISPGDVPCDCEKES